MSLKFIFLLAVIGSIASGIYTYSSIGGEDLIGYIMYPLANLLAAIVGGLIVVLLDD